MAASILIADDDAVARRLVENMVQKCGYETVVVDSGDAAIAALTAPDAPAIDGVILDLVMPGLDGMGVLAKIREAGLSIPVIVQTAHGGIDNVVSAMRAGATDFVVKPASPERLQVSLANALATRRLAGELQRLKKRQDGTFAIADIVTHSPAMGPVLRAAEMCLTAPPRLLKLLHGPACGFCCQMFHSALLVSAMEKTSMRPSELTMEACSRMVGLTAG